MPTAVITDSGLILNAFVRRAGDGIPFLFVHGLASNARLWDQVAESLMGHGHDSVAVDQRGHGESAPADDGYDFSTLAGDLAAAVRSQLDRPVIAVGQSWGGNVVLEFGARYPDLVAGLALVDGGFLRLGDGFRTWGEAKEALTPPSFNGLTLEDLRVRMRTHLPDFSEAALDAQLANFETMPDGYVRSRLRLTNHLQILWELWQHDPDVVASRVRVPTSVIAVAGDPKKATRVADFVQQAGASVHWVEGHHDVHAEQPQLVSQILLELAAEVGR